MGTGPAIGGGCDDSREIQQMSNNHVTPGTEWMTSMQELDWQVFNLMNNMVCALMQVRPVQGDVGSWFRENGNDLQEMYRLASQATSATGILFSTQHGMRIAREERIGKAANESAQDLTNMLRARRSPDQEDLAPGYHLDTDREDRP